MTTSNATMTPTGEDAPAAAMHRALKQDEMTNTQDLFEAVLTRDNLTRAWKQALSNAWLKTQGLVSVKDLWCKAQGYAG